MKKGLKVFLIIVIVLVLIAGAAVLVLPRILVDATVSKVGGKEIVAAEKFEDYSVVLDENVTEAENSHISVDIPSKYVYDSDKNIENSQVFSESGGVKVIVMDKWEWGEEMNLVAILEKGEYENYKFDGKAFMAEIENMGLPMPDSAFNTYKFLYLMDKKQYDTLNLNQRIIYAVAATMRNEMLPEMGEAYIYETDTVKGFVHVRENVDSENGKYFVTLEIYGANDLNTSTTVMVYTDDLDEAYGIMNSAVEK